MNKHSQTLAYDPSDIARIAARLRGGEQLPDAFEGLDGPAIRRCLIAVGCIKPGAANNDEPTPSRYLDEGEYLRQRCYEDIPNARGKRFTGVVGVWKVPPTLRLDRLGAREAQRVLARVFDDRLLGGGR